METLEIGRTIKQLLDETAMSSLLPNTDYHFTSDWSHTIHNIPNSKMNGT